MTTLLQSPSTTGALPPVVLASRSPRRRELLSSAGIIHSFMDPGVDDAQLLPGHVSPEQWVTSLAYLKAATAARLLDPSTQAIILAADTLVIHNNAILGQPRDEADARRMLLAMRDAEHDVVTGVALLDPITHHRDLFADRASVRVGHIPDADIETYLASNDWRGKAGAYNLSERLSAGWPIEFDGDPGTIMGLPMRKLPSRLRAFARRDRSI